MGERNRLRALEAERGFGRVSTRSRSSEDALTDVAIRSAAASTSFQRTRVNGATWMVTASRLLTLSSQTPAAQPSISSTDVPLPALS